MTEAARLVRMRDYLSGALGGGITLEMRKTRAGASLLVTDVLVIEEFSSEKICIVTHKGRILIHGTRLEISVFEKRCVEIFGRIIGLEMGYGKV